MMTYNTSIIIYILEDLKLSENNKNVHQYNFNYEKNITYICTWRKSTKTLTLAICGLCNCG